MEDLYPNDEHDEKTVSMEQTAPEKPAYRRSLIFSILLIFSFVYNGFMFLVLSAGLFFNSIVWQIFEQYFQQVHISSTITFLLNLSGAALFGISIFGLIKIWMAKKTGLWYFSISQIIILFTILVFLHSYDWLNIAIAAGVMIIIGLFARKMK